MTPSTASRRRLVEAMGLGPLWLLRAPADDVRDAPLIPASRARRIASLDWAALEDDVAHCTACDLSRSRRRTVFGAGVRRPDWLVIGAAPRQDDDARGEPFAGQAGKLLDAMLASVGLSRERNVFVIDLVKCRPPEDREPSSDEAACCRPYLERQIALLAPKIVLALGSSVAHLLDVPRDTHERRHMLTIAGRDMPLVTIPDPDRLLQSGEEKSRAWADLCFAREVFQQVESASTPST